MHVVGGGGDAIAGSDLPHALVFGVEDEFEGALYQGAAVILGDFAHHVETGVFERLMFTVGVDAFDQVAVGVVVVGGSTLGCAAADRGDGVRAPGGGGAVGVGADVGFLGDVALGVVADGFGGDAQRGCAGGADQAV